jgi:hypothetical protein
MYAGEQRSALKSRLKNKLWMAMALAGALRRCPSHGKCSHCGGVGAWRLAIAAWLYAVPGLRCDPFGQNHIRFHNLFRVGTLFYPIPIISRICGL